MNYAEVKAVRIICDGVLKNSILEKVMQFGAGGYTWWEAHGKGRKENINSIWHGLDRLYIEIWCSQEVCDRIVQYYESDQFRNHGVTVGVETLLVKESELSKYS
jgi:hypothetical protein